MEPDLAIEALDRAVRIALARGREDDSETIARAEAFYSFLLVPDSESARRELASE